MKKALKVTFGTMLAASLSSAVLASESDIMNHGAVWVTGTYTTASNNGESYGAIVQNSGNLQAPSPTILRNVFVDNDGELDYAFGFSYRLPCSDTRLFASYDHFRDDENNSQNSHMGNLDLGYTAPFGTGTASVVHHSDEVRLGLIRTLHFGRCFHLDLNGFFEWDQVKRDMDERITVDNTPASTRFRNTHNEVEGWGPGIGARVRTTPFHCYPHVGFFAGGNTTLLWADSEFEANIYNGDGALLFNWDPEDSDSVVGKIDISFGVNYSRAIRDLCGGMVFDLALGMRYMNVFNAFKNGNTYNNYISNLNGSGGAFHNTPSLGWANDFGRVGPFLTFGIGGLNA